jgi:hypothetical protein
MDDTPKTIIEAYSSPDVDYWKEAMKSEWILSCQMELGRLLNVPTGANLWDANGHSKRSLGLMVLLISTRLDLWPWVTPKRKEKTSLILTHQSLD